MWEISRPCRYVVKIGFEKNKQVWQEQKNNFFNILLQADGLHSCNNVASVTY